MKWLPCNIYNMNCNIYNFEGKNILIDGGGRGIGKATAQLLAKLGARIILLDMKEHELKETVNSLEGDNHIIHTFDLSNLGQISTVISEIAAEVGGIDGYVHCVGIRSYQPLKVLDYSSLQKVMNVNFVSFVEMTRQLMKKGNYNKGLSVVAISSISSKNGGAGVTAYAASKAAIDGAIRSMAPELAKKGARINSVMPGQTHTEAYDEIVGDSVDPVLNRQYLGLSEPSDIANVIVFLLSDSSRMITGAAIPVDGGYFTA